VVRTAWEWTRELVVTMRRHRILDLAAIFSYWSLLAIFPFAIFLLTVIGYVPLRGIDLQLFDTVHRIMPEQAARLFEHTVREVIGRQRGWLLFAALFGALWSATGGMSSTLTALNRAWGVEETRPWWRRKVLCIGMTVGAAGLLVVATCAMLIGPQLLGKVAELMGGEAGAHVVWRWARWPLSVSAAMVALALVYHFLPNVKQPFRLFQAGNVVAVLLWTIASAGFNAYVRHFHSYAKTYGTLGAAVVLMIWLYLTGLTVILGGEVNALVARKHGQAVARGPSTLTSPVMSVVSPDGVPLPVVAAGGSGPDEGEGGAGPADGGGSSTNVPTSSAR
jgi:membrane protein